MESEFNSIIIERNLNFNNSQTRYEYTYNNEGLLTDFNEKYKINDGDFKNNGTYSYEYSDGKLSSVILDGKDIYFPSPYFVSIRSQGDELLFDFEINNEGNIIAIVLHDKNGKKFYFKDKLLTSIESIGTSENRLSARYDYYENETLKRYRQEYSEGKGQSAKRTRYDFIYSEEGVIEKYLFEKSGQGQDFERISCTFEHITNEDQTINTSFALNEEGEIVRTARFNYENRNNYNVEIFDDQEQLIVSYKVEKK